MLLHLQLRVLQSLLEQEGNVATEAHLGQDLQIGVALLDCFVDEDALGIQHFVVDLLADVCSRVMTQNYSFVGFLDLSFPEHLKQKWGSID